MIDLKKLIYGKCKVLNPYIKEIDLIDYCFPSYVSSNKSEVDMWNRLFEENAIYYTKQKYLQKLDEEQPIIIEDIEIPIISKEDFKEKIKNDIMKEWEKNVNDK